MKPLIKQFTVQIRTKQISYFCLTNIIFMYIFGGRLLLTVSMCHRCVCLRISFWGICMCSWRWCSWRQKRRWRRRWPRTAPSWPGGPRSQTLGTPGLCQPKQHIQFYCIIYICYNNLEDWYLFGWLYKGNWDIMVIRLLYNWSLLHIWEFKLWYI